MVVVVQVHLRQDSQVQDSTSRSREVREECRDPPKILGRTHKHSFTSFCSTAPTLRPLHPVPSLIIPRFTPYSIKFP